MSEFTPKEVADYAIELAEVMKNEIFDVHSKLYPDVYTEDSRPAWERGFLSGFASGFTIVVMRAEHKMKNMPVTRIPEPGAN